MTTPTGTIGLSDVNAELGYSPTALIGMNDSAVRTLAGVGGSGTPITMDDLRGKSNRVVMSLTISSSTYNYNAYTAASSQPTYNAGKTDLTVTIGPGVVVGSTSTGTYAFSVPSSFNPGDTVTVVNNGTIIGKGGSGGAGANSTLAPRQPGSPGGTGGSATLIQRPVTFTNNGTIAGGGGGGGGGGMKDYTVVIPEQPSILYLMSGGGGGGGAGYDGGPGGAGGTSTAGYAPLPGSPGSPGTVPAGGGGGAGGNSGAPYGRAGNGGSGGGQGASGSSGGGGSPPANASPGGGGGGAGPYMVGVPYVSWPATGTRLGPSS